MDETEGSVLPPSVNQPTGELTEYEGIPIPQTKTMKHFWPSLINGKYEPPTKKQTAELVDRELFSSEPLTPITPAEESCLRQRASKKYEFTHGRDKLRTIIEHPLALLIPHKNTEYSYQNQPHLLDVSNKTLNQYINDNSSLSNNNDLHISSLSTKEKVQYLSDPNFFFHVGLCQGGITSASLKRYGNRYLFGEGNYGFTHQTFKDMLNETRESTGKSHLVVMDIGGGMGRALHDAKSVDQDITTINLTMEDEPTNYTADRTILSLAERMPKSLEESVDVILSYQAFRYFAYPDIAAYNTIKALTVGGKAKINFDFEHCDQCKERLPKLKETLIQLKKEGAISIKIGKKDPEEIDDLSEMWNVWRIVKNKSTKGRNLRDVQFR